MHYSIISFYPNENVKVRFDHFKELRYAIDFLCFLRHNEIPYILIDVNKNAFLSLEFYGYKYSDLEVCLFNEKGVRL